MPLFDPLFATNRRIRFIYDRYLRQRWIVWFDMRVLGAAWYDSPCRVAAMEALDPRPGDRVLDAAVLGAWR